ncbi:MAG TPA: hypothetical protein PKZ17_05575, partial [Thermodesulfovibrio thiophilus]|nr:hypothetical protein [Thermodesulfovibrio thiophilus]
WKLVDWDNPDLRDKIKPCSPRHTFNNFDFSQLSIKAPSSPSWWGQFSGEVKSLTSTKVPKDYISDVLLTNIADELSASISRTWGEKKGKVAEGLYVLWNPDYYQKRVNAGEKWAAFTTPDGLREMFQFIEECNTPEDFFDRYSENLRLTAEDKSVPINIVDLYTHLELTGKIYRVLKKHSQTIEDNGTLYLKYLGDKIQKRNDATGGRIGEPTNNGKWIYRLIFCYINFPQSFSRLQDLNVFRKRADLIKSFSEDEKTKDYVLFFTDDFMCVFIPREDELKIQELLQSFLDAGFIIDYKEMEAELNLLTSSMERAYVKFHSLASSRYLKLYEKNLISNFIETINPPLCDSCQMRHGKERIKDQVHEYLCDTCYEIRQMGDPARKYAKWEEKGLRAGWIKITLDQEQLSRTLHSLYEEYVDTHPAMQDVSSNDKDELKESFRPIAVQMDFVKDYKLLLNAFNKQIYEIKDKNGNSLFTKENFLFPIEVYYEFGIFKVYSGEEILVVLDLFYNLLEKYFPECLKDSPIKLSISLAQVKYPHREHWRFLSMPKNIINIQSPGSSKLSIDISQYKLLRDKIRREDAKLSHFLHRLADIEIETKSNMSVMLEIFNNRKKFPVLLELIQSGLSVHQILIFYKLTSEVTIL